MHRMVQHSMTGLLHFLLLPLIPSPLTPLLSLPLPLFLLLSLLTPLGGGRCDANTTRGPTSIEEVHDASPSWRLG
eukprot:2090884-Pyramimonas_sp.AAC.1